MANATVIRLRLRSEQAQASSLAAVAAAAFARTGRALRSLWCTMNGGHYRVLHTEPSRMALRCVACGHMTPGWDISSRRPVPRYPGDPKRLRTTRVVPTAVAKR